MVRDTELFFWWSSFTLFGDNLCWTWRQGGAHEGAQRKGRRSPFLNFGWYNRNPYNRMVCTEYMYKHFFSKFETVRFLKAWVQHKTTKPTTHLKRISSSKRSLFLLPCLVELLIIILFEIWNWFFLIVEIINLKGERLKRKKIGD